MKPLFRTGLVGLALLLGAGAIPFAVPSAASGVHPVVVASGCPSMIPPHDRGVPATITGAIREPRHKTGATDDAKISVRVYVHVLRSRPGTGVSTPRIRRQIAILNHAYAGAQSRFAAVAPFRFHLVDIDRTTNARWWRMDEGTVAEARAKHALHRGTSRDLNLYIGMNRSGNLGWGTPPAQFKQAPRMDGVVIRRTSMAGGRGGHHSSGDTAVHETGHWLGLLHTFTGRCGARGDLVGDTPREARPSYACPVRRDTCSARGRDPVHNFMDYSYDSCMNQFTAGQVGRMRQQWSAYRRGGG
ncbi:MAG TPA: zinc metalloprotease [Nocardioidaceae bacterium]